MVPVWGILLAHAALRMRNLLFDTFLFGTAILILHLYVHIFKDGLKTYSPSGEDSSLSPFKAENGENPSLDPQPHSPSFKS